MLGRSTSVSSPLPSSPTTRPRRSSRTNSSTPSANVLHFFPFFLFSLTLPVPEGSPEQVQAYKQLIGKLDPIRRACAKEMFYVFYLVSLEEKRNFMHATNLATIFGGMVDIVSNVMNQSCAFSLFCLDPQ